MEWLMKWNEAIEYIEANLDKTISYEEVARIACCSPCYFQRIFSYVAGLSLSEYIRRRKMTQAAYDLQQKDCKVIDIALQYGYLSPTSFNRAFQNVHGIAPIKARKSGCRLHAYPPLHFSVHISNRSPLIYTTERKGAMRFITAGISNEERDKENRLFGTTRCTQNFDEDVLSQLAELSGPKSELILMAKFTQDFGQIENRIAVCSDQPIPLGRTVHTVVEAMWVIFEHHDQSEELPSFFHRCVTEFSQNIGKPLLALVVYPHFAENGKDFEVWITAETKGET